MRHRKKSEKFSRSRAQRAALVKSLLRGLIVNERIVTTESKAKGVRPTIERLITWAKSDNLHRRRLAYQLLCDHNLVKRLFERIGPRFKNIAGGYTRIIDVGFRKGDCAKLSILEFTKIERKEKKPKVKKEKEVVKTEETLKVKEERHIPKKEEKPSKGILAGIKRIFKKERDAL